MDELKYSFQDKVTVGAVERKLPIMAIHENPTNPVVIDLSQCKHVDVGAGWLLGNALRRFQTCSSLRVHVPEPPENFSDFWFLEFTRSGLAFSLAKYATQIIAPSGDITSRVRDYYSHGRQKQIPDFPNVEKIWTGPRFCCIAGLESGSQGSLDPDHESTFVQLFNHLCILIKIDPAVYEKATYNELGRFAFQAVQNVYDHANKKPLPSDTNILTYLAIKHYKEINIKSMDKRFEVYRSRIVGQLPKDYDHDGWIEIVINDDGVGIAARLTQDSGLYWREDRDEETALTEALKDGITIKLDTQENIRRDPGKGFSIMEDMLGSIHAYALLRTGRRSVTFDASDENVTFQPCQETQGYMPGTTLQVVFPRRLAKTKNANQVRQGQPSLF